MRQFSSAPARARTFRPSFFQWQLCPLFCGCEVEHFKDLIYKRSFARAKPSDLPLLRGIALHGLDQVGNEIGATLILTDTCGHRALALLNALSLAPSCTANFRKDTLELPKSEFADIATVLGDAHQNGADTIIAHDAHDIITLHNVSLSQLHDSYILLV